MLLFNIMVTSSPKSWPAMRARCAAWPTTSPRPSARPSPVVAVGLLSLIVTTAVNQLDLPSALQRQVD